MGISSLYYIQVYGLYHSAVHLHIAHTGIHKMKSLYHSAVHLHIAHIHEMTSLYHSTVHLHIAHIYMRSLHCTISNSGDHILLYIHKKQRTLHCTVQCSNCIMCAYSEDDVTVPENRAVYAQYAHCTNIYI